MQCLSKGVNIAHVLQGIPAEKYMKMLTADNVAKMLELVDPGKDETLLDAKGEVQVEVKSLIEEEVQLHNQVKALAASAVIRVSILTANMMC